MCEKLLWQNTHFFFQKNWAFFHKNNLATLLGFIKSIHRWNAIKEGEVGEPCTRWMEVFHKNLSHLHSCAIFLGEVYKKECNYTISFELKNMRLFYFIEDWHQGLQWKRFFFIVTKKEQVSLLVSIYLVYFLSKMLWQKLYVLSLKGHCMDSFYTLSVDKNRHFLTPSPLIFST